MRKLEQRLAIFIVLVLSIGISLAYMQARSSPPPAPAPVAPKPLTVAVVGDSITEGVSDPADPRHEESYPAQLQTLLGSDYKVINYGASGRTLLDTGDLPYTQSPVYITSHQTNPNIVLIMLGTNDSKPQNWNAREYEPQLTKFVLGYANLPSHPKVYVMTPPAAFANDINVSGAVIEHEIIPAISRVAAKTHVSVVDIFSVISAHPEYLTDGVHPNAEGAKAIAQRIKSSLK